MKTETGMSGLLLIVSGLALFGASGCGRTASGGRGGPIAPAVLRPNGIAPAPGASETGTLVAVLRRGVDVWQVCADYGLVVDDSLPDGHTYRVHPNSAATGVLSVGDYTEDSRIESFAPNYFAENAESRQSSMAFDEGFLDADQFLHQTSLKKLGIGRAHQVATGDGVVVAVLDTGVDPTHPALSGKLDPAGFDFVENDNDPSDVPDFTDNDGDGLVDEATGHGTHVAGIITLVAPGARLLILRVLDSDGRGTAFNVARAIEYAADHGATVLNASLGMLEPSDAVAAALDYATKRSMVIVAPAGNWGAEQPEEYPASDSRVWAVAASDTLDVAAGFTSYAGYVVMSAPGTHIRSAYWDGGYASWSGTSMSAPFVTGTAALLRQLHPEWTKAQMLYRIQSTADRVIALTTDQSGKLGAGRVNISAAVGLDGIGVISGSDVNGQLIPSLSTSRTFTP